MKKSEQPAAAKRKVLIVDDHPILREGLGKIVNQQADLSVCGEAGNAPDGLTAVAKFRPDVAIVDISLEGGSGLDLIRDIRARQPKLPILALSMHHEDIYAARALHAGANGYVMKSESPGALLTALRKVLNGQAAVSDNVVNRLVNHHSHGEPSTGRSPAELLSDRELEIFRALGEGQSTREIAAKLHIAVSTVESYRASIKQKLCLKNATELVSSAARFTASLLGE